MSELEMTKKLLIFSAHPDDNLSCAGFALYLKDLGFELYEIVFVGGGKGVWKNKGDDKPIDPKELVEVRKKEFEQASKILGTTRYQFLGLEDNNIVRTPELIEKLMGIIREIRPTVIMTENPNDYHIDHRAVGTIVTEAADRAGWGVSKKLGEPYRTPVVLYMGSLIENERSDILVDTTKYQKEKQMMLKAYGSQMGSSGFQLTEALDKYRGYQMRTDYAESFEVAKNYPIRLNNLLGVIGYERKKD